ncbi:MAG TPA: GatB/YqeY domain-containing protein [Candidatus Saccharibacteria bacterium]|jgi:uncharacterized protein YqeY|nr:GatB/YqeY domain-containing protein [Candidatus Saccharibacteria bacterium]HMT55733.1 GatB/YqeY domain-containing protein [Candidatus Saccharibacteria bacterium]
MLKATIDSDLKAAMLSGNKQLVEALRGIKSAVLYKEVADGKRESGLSDPEIVGVLKKEAKARKDAIALYDQAQETERSAYEKFQLDIIESYLPEEMSEAEIKEHVDKVIQTLGLSEVTIKDMGKIIGEVKASAPTADGGLVAKVVKQLVQG